MKSHCPDLVEEVASPATIESLIVLYLSLSYDIPDRDAQIIRHLSAGDFNSLSEDEIERCSTIISTWMYDRGEREAKLKRLGYPTSFS